MFSRVFASKHATRALMGAAGAVGTGMVSYRSRTDGIIRWMAYFFQERRYACLASDGYGIYHMRGLSGYLPL